MEKVTLKCGVWWEFEQALQNIRETPVKSCLDSKPICITYCKCLNHLPDYILLPMLKNFVLMIHQRFSFFLRQISVSNRGNNVKMPSRALRNVVPFCIPFLWKVRKFH